MQNSMFKSFQIYEFHRATVGLSEKELIQLAEKLEKQGGGNDKAETDLGDIAQSSD